MIIKIMLTFLCSCSCIFTKKPHQDNQVAVVESSAHEEAHDHFEGEKLDPILELYPTERTRSSSILSECSDANIDQILIHLNADIQKVIIFADDSLVCLKLARRPLVRALDDPRTAHEPHDFPALNWRDSGLVYENINNHFIIYVGNGDIAFRVFKQIPEEHSIIVFTDNNMPHKKGLDLIESIKRTTKKQPLAFALHTSDDATSLPFLGDDIVYLKKNVKEPIHDFFKDHCIPKPTSTLSHKR